MPPVLRRDMSPQVQSLRDIAELAAHGIAKDLSQLSQDLSSTLSEPTAGGTSHNTGGKKSPPLVPQVQGSEGDAHQRQRAEEAHQKVHQGAQNNREAREDEAVRSQQRAEKELREREVTETSEGQKALMAAWKAQQQTAEVSIPPSQL